MATFEFVLPELGEGIEAGDVVQVLVSVGDSITEEQPVLELETDKAVVEVPAPVSGTVKAIHVQAGDKAAVGQLLLTVETPAATAAVAQAPRTPSPCRRVTAATRGAWREQDGDGYSGAKAARASCTHGTSASSPVAHCPSPLLLSNRPSHRVLQCQQHRPYDNWHAKLAWTSIRSQGSGPGGRISLEDVKRYARDLHTRPAGQPPPRRPACCDAARLHQMGSSSSVSP